MTTATTKREPMKNPSRERRKAERLALSAEVARLEHALATRMHAHSELRKRRLAECTNYELHEALQRQESTLVELARRLASGVPPVPSRRLHDTQGRRFAMLLDDVERAFHEELEDVLATIKPSWSDNFDSRLVQHRDELVLAASRSTPVVGELRRCAVALWNASEQVARVTHPHASISRPTKDVVCLRLHASAVHGDEKTKETWAATSSVVEKRFWIGDRLAIVWRSVTSIDNLEALADVYVDETGWTVVTEDEETGGVRVAECVHTVPRSTRQDEDVPKAHAEAVKAFTRHVMDATTAHLNAIRDRMENLLIDDCMRDVDPSNTTEL